MFNIVWSLLGTFGEFIIFNLWDTFLHIYVQICMYFCIHKCVLIVILLSENQGISKTDLKFENNQ